MVKLPMCPESMEEQEKSLAQVLYDIKYMTAYLSVKKFS